MKPEVNALRKPENMARDVVLMDECLACRMQGTLNLITSITKDMCGGMITWELEAGSEVQDHSWFQVPGWYSIYATKPRVHLDPALKTK